MSQYFYHVEKLVGSKWMVVPGSEGGKKCWGTGYCRAMNDVTPSPKVRLMRSDGRVMIEAGGNG